MLFCLRLYFCLCPAFLFAFGNFVGVLLFCLRFIFLFASCFFFLFAFSFFFDDVFFFVCVFFFLWWYVLFCLRFLFSLMMCSFLFAFQFFFFSLVICFFLSAFPFFSGDVFFFVCVFFFCLMCFCCCCLRFPFLFVLALFGHRIKVIEISQANNYRLPHWKKTSICPWKFPEIRPGIFDRMVSALNLKFFFPIGSARENDWKQKIYLAFYFKKTVNNWQCHPGNSKKL